MSLHPMIMNFFKAVLCFILLATSFAQAVPLSLLPENGQVDFLAIGRPSAIKIAGKGIGPSGEIQVVNKGNDLVISGQAKFDLASLETGISLRDRHMKEKYLEVDRFREALLNFDLKSLPKNKILAGEELTVVGRLTLHGVEKPVDIILSKKLSGDVYEIETKFKVKLSDFAIAIPSFAGVTVADEVDVRVVTKLSVSELKEIL